MKGISATDRASKNGVFVDPGPAGLRISVMVDGVVKWMPTLISWDELTSLERRMWIEEGAR